MLMKVVTHCPKCWSTKYTSLSFGDIGAGKGYRCLRCSSLFALDIEPVSVDAAPEPLEAAVFRDSSPWDSI